MNSRTIFKIKDSVDLFLSNEKYIIVYFMNSRQRKSFRVNDDRILVFPLSKNCDFSIIPIRRVFD